MAERFDFETLIPSIWVHLYSWYSADSQVVRFMKRDKLNKKQMTLDLYPESRFKHQSYMNLYSSESEEEVSFQREE